MQRMTTATTESAPVSPERVSEPSREDLQPGRAATLLQRVIMPRSADPLKVRSLYLDEESAGRVINSDRYSATVSAGRELSFATYFNAFPASYWRRWTSLDNVVLKLQLSGAARIDIYRSKANGDTMHVTGAPSEGTDQKLAFELELAPFTDGGWYWFDITADTETTVTSSGWYAEDPPVRPARLAVGMCTFNRPVDCVSALEALAGDDVAMSNISDVIVADQGNKKVRDAGRFPEVEAKLGDRLRILEQPNLGGSGGFARAMHEMSTATDATHLVFLDDDIQLEPDSVARALAFASFTTRPTLVGGQMLALQDRSVLHVMGEVVERDKFFWRNAPHTEYGHDFASETLRESPDLHRRIDVDYNGWWMCLIPREVIETIGLPLPLFIKWDDAEYGLRAAEHGFPTVTLPGVAIWHLSWTDKDDTADWQAYFHWRNRLIVAALHSPRRRGGSLLRDLFKWDLKYLIMLQYSAAALHQRAYEDFLTGPDGLFDLLPTVLTQVRAQQQSYDDGRVIPSATDFPLPTMSPVKAERMLKPPTNPVTISRTLAGALAHNLFPTRGDEKKPQLNVAAQDARWFLLARLDSATVGTADGRGVTYRRRDPRIFWSLLKRSVALEWEIYRRFPALKKAYKDALPDLTSAEAWSKVFTR
jgi:galactofuranosylgalactofuranosylrhamnosyl-N-acetylglucosaminyl-diphospho-decaprenol beta-1,5/1,6-galactofuranosyltransferase